MTKFWATPYTECQLSSGDEPAPSPGVVRLVVNAPAIAHPPYPQIHVTSSTNMSIARHPNVTRMTTEAVDRAGSAVRVVAKIEAHQTTVQLDPPLDPMPADWVADPLVFWALLYDDCITMHAAVLTIDDAVVIFTGFHNAGKSTLASQLARSIAGAELLADDQVVINVDKNLTLCAGYADELAGNRGPVTCSRALVVVLGEEGVHDRAGQWLALSQFVVGLGFESSTTKLAGDGLERLLNHADVTFAPARASSLVDRQVRSWLHHRNLGEES